MKFFRLGMAVITVLVLLAAGIYFFAENERVEAMVPQLAEFKQQIDSWLTEQEVEQQVTTLTERSAETLTQTKQVLGESITAHPDEQPLHEKALEYGQYIYCKQVVKEYESIHSELELQSSAASEGGN